MRRTGKRNGFQEGNLSVGVGNVEIKAATTKFLEEL